MKATKKRSKAGKRSHKSDAQRNAGKTKRNRTPRGLGGRTASRSRKRSLGSLVASLAARAERLNKGGQFTLRQAQDAILLAAIAWVDQGPPDEDYEQPLVMASNETKVSSILFTLHSAYELAAGTYEGAQQDDSRRYVRRDDAPLNAFAAVADRATRALHDAYNPMRRPSTNRLKQTTRPQAIADCVERMAEALSVYPASSIARQSKRNEFVGCDICRKDIAPRTEVRMVWLSSDDTDVYHTDCWRNLGVGEVAKAFAMSVYWIPRRDWPVGFERADVGDQNEESFALEKKCAAAFADSFSAFVEKGRRWYAPQSAGGRTAAFGDWTSSYYAQGELAKRVVSRDARGLTCVDVQPSLEMLEARELLAVGLEVWGIDQRTRATWLKTYDRSVKRGAR